MFISRSKYENLLHSVKLAAVEAAGYKAKYNCATDRLIELQANVKRANDRRMEARSTPDMVERARRRQLVDMSSRNQELRDELQEMANKMAEMALRMTAVTPGMVP